MNEGYELYVGEDSITEDLLLAKSRIGGMLRDLVCVVPRAARDCQINYGCRRYYNMYLPAEPYHRRTVFVRPRATFQLPASDPMSPKKKRRSSGSGHESSSTSSPATKPRRSKGQDRNDVDPSATSSGQGAEANQRGNGHATATTGMPEAPPDQDQNPNLAEQRRAENPVDCHDTMVQEETSIPSQIGGWR